MLGFDSTHAFFQTRQFNAFTVLAEVKYSDKRPVMPAPEKWDGSKEQIERVLSVEDLADLLFYTKSKDWEYEQELRIIANPQVANRADKTPCGENLYLYEFPPGCLKEVIFGMRMPRDRRLQIMKLVRERYENVQLFEAVLSDEHFNLGINPFG